MPFFITVHILTFICRDHPEIKPNYLSEKEDLDVLVEGIKFVYNLTNTETFKNLKAEPQRVESMHCGDFEVFIIET